VASGVTRLVAVGVDLATSVQALSLAGRHPEVFAGVGHHPVNKAPPDGVELARLADNPRVVLIGEVGLDSADSDAPPLHEQQRWLHEMCGLAVERALPVSVHTRGTEAAVYDVLSQHPGLTGVMHYFSLDWEWADRFLGLGFYLSFSGLLTRPSRHALRDVAVRCPADRLLLETDSPYGTPHRRGREPNRPAWLCDTAQLVAQLRGIELQSLAALELANARRLFTRLD
jgi:TatD DNase family protein